MRLGWWHVWEADDLSRPEHIEGGLSLALGKFGSQQRNVGFSPRQSETGVKEPKFASNKQD